MSTDAAILIALLVMVGVLFVRNQIVYSIRRHRIDAIHAANVRDIGRSDFSDLMNRRYADLDRPGYSAMVLDMRRWTYSQFYQKEPA